MRGIFSHESIRLNSSTRISSDISLQVKKYVKRCFCVNAKVCPSGKLQRFAREKNVRSLQTRNIDSAGQRAQHLHARNTSYLSTHRYRRDVSSNIS